jgi:hypothetical protein
MGYSARYHAASLAAIFVALAVGILIGVGFGSDVLTGTAESLERSLRDDLDSARDQVDDLQAQLQQEGEFGRLAYPALVDGRLRGKEIGVVALGDIGDDLAGDIRAAVQTAGGTLQEVAVVREPPDFDAVADVSARRPQLSREEEFDRSIRSAGTLLVHGGRRFADLRSVFFSRYSGEPGDVDAVVVARSRPGDLPPRQSEQTDRLEEGLLDALADQRIPVVGAERADAPESSTGFFDANVAASVDDVNQLPGKVSLVYTLDCAEGDYGVKDTADALLPDLLAPRSLACGAGGAE